LDLLQKDVLDPKVLVSVITPSFNSAAYISDCVTSVKRQDYRPIQHILADGESTDKTTELAKAASSGEIQIYSERDEGIYDAFNKGISRANGEIIGLLNSDDFYPHDGVIRRVVDEFQNKSVDIVYGDLLYVSQSDTKKITRRYSSKKFSPLGLSYGWIPAHPTVFVRRTVYENFGLFDKTFKIAGDFEFLARIFSKIEIKYSYIPEVLVHMREGGVSNVSLRSRWKTNQEILRACRQLGLPTNTLKLSLRYFSKLSEYFNPAL